MHLSFSYLLHHSVSTASCSMAVCTFHFYASYTLKPWNPDTDPLYAPFIFTPLTPLGAGCLVKRLLYASSILVVEGLFLC